MSKFHAINDYFDPDPKNNNKLVCIKCSRSYDKNTRITTLKNHYRFHHKEIWNDIKVYNVGKGKEKKKRNESKKIIQEQTFQEDYEEIFDEAQYGTNQILSSVIKDSQYMNEIERSEEVTLSVNDCVEIIPENNNGEIPFYLKDHIKSIDFYDYGNNKLEFDGPNSIKFNGPSNKHNTFSREIIQILNDSIGQKSYVEVYPLHNYIDNIDYGVVIFGNRADMIKIYFIRTIILHKSREYMTDIVECTEEYTSKTCGVCRIINDKLGSSKVFKCKDCGYVYDRDFNGARNILLKYLTETGFLHPNDDC
ncbi:5949_t:CDS:2 [Scutellospora calospora]|uniref:5949_t:CDS:1 n=1 Tax=Scutellospora calospora TaxID=85575 RepID=A0ACA9JW80_9GLOM|nr:5949_t:CDS:2 [Scutellospora calospora]